MNNNTQHTPGPYYTNSGQIIQESTGKTLALIPYFDNGNEEERANAELFANAPEMAKEIEDLKQTIFGLKTELQAAQNTIAYINQTQPSHIVKLQRDRAELLEAGRLIIKRWQRGDLAEAVRGLAEAISKATEGHPQ